jgi:cytoskeletal protein RodZ
MKTIGQMLKEARVKKEFSLSHVEGMTKIKKSFIESIENENWNDLPAFPTVLGFVKSLAGILGVEEKTAVAILKRDYPPKKISISPKPDVYSKFSWSPKLTFLVGIGAALVIIFGYLVFQYFQFISPPHLAVDSPKDDQVVTTNTVLVFGSTDIDAKLLVNNQPVLLDSNGKFSTNLEVTSETKEITVIATSRSGKVAVIHRRISVQ